jgi:hypothetical protein
MPEPLTAAPELYFMNRLGTLRRSQELTASMQFDLARSPLTDDELDEVTDAFGGNASATGFGFSEALRDSLSREPKRIPVGDIQTLQSNLIAQGYAPETAVPNGSWDPTWYAYFRRWDRDNYEKVLAGHHWGAAPIEAGFRLIANTLPSRVWQGVLGAAKGLQAQAFGTDTEEGSLERLGALGGAVGGAAVGTAIAPGVGTLVGAGAGAAIGFFADLFGEDEAEMDQSVGAKLLDALSPLEEYQDKGWKAFWEDLGFIATATSLAAGGRMAVTGVQGAVAGAKAAAVQTNTPALTAALARPAMAQPGFATKIIAGATKKFAPGTGAWIEQQAIRYGPIAQMQRPAFQVVNKAYTGLSAGSIGARLSGGFDLGTGAVDQTTIEKAIVETDPLESGISLPFLGDLVDWAAFVLVPERFLPFKAGALGAGARRMMGDVSMWPYIHALQTADPRLTTGAARAKALELISAERNTYMRLDYGVHTEAIRLAKEHGVDYATARAQVVRNIHAERSALTGPVNTENLVRSVARGELPDELPLTTELLSRSLRDQEKFAGWLVDLPGAGVNKFDAYAETAARARGATRDVRSGRYLVTEHPQGFVATSSGLEIGTARGQTLQQAALKREADDLEKLIVRRERQAARATDPAITTRLTAEVRQLQERLETVRTSITDLDQVPTRIGEINVMAATDDFLTRGELFRIRDEFNALREEVHTTFDGELSVAHQVARQKLSVLVHDLAARGYIPDKLAQKAVEAGARPGDEVARHLEEAAQRAARDVQLSPEDMTFFSERGYKPVVTGEDVIQLDEIGSIAEVFGIGEYTRRASFFETLGISGRFVKEENQFALKVAHERASLNQVFEENGLAVSGQQALTRIHGYLEQQNREGVVWGPLLKKMRGRPHLPYVDPRQLTPEDLFKIFEDIPEFTEQHARSVMGALKRGGALGADVKLMNPLVSARTLGRSMRVSGLPGFSDFVRTIHAPVTPKALSTAAGAALGATTGYLLGDEPKDVIRGAIGGAALGLGYSAAAKRTYGYLPDALARMNLALRYTFSLTFDAGRYTEQAMIAATRYGLPAHFMPRRALTQKAEGWATPYSAERVHGEDAVRDAMRFQDELNGTPYFGGLEDMERRVFQAGLLGFKPRDFEALYGFELYQRGWGREQIRDAVANINRYGMGRTVAEKTANFVFFPFSFSKKMLTSLGDFILQAPGRNLLLHEGLRRYHDSSLDERFRDLVENHAPLLEQLAQVNNLVYGLSPGRFFLEGLSDHRTAAGSVAQILSSIFVPSGAATTLAVAAGQAGDLAMNAFVPVVITGESIDKAGGVDGLDDIIRRYVPLVREIDQYFFEGEGNVTGGAIGKQLAAVTSPTFETPYAQLTGYLDETRAFKSELEPLALALGYVSADGLLDSDVGVALKAQYDALKDDLRLKYPQGWGLVSEIDNTDLINQAAMNDLATQVADGYASPGEEAILLVAQEARFLKTFHAEIGMPADIGSALLGARIRTLAKKYQGDERFLELYRRFFEREYGPLQAIAA